MENTEKETMDLVAHVPAELEELVPWFMGNMKETLESIQSALEKRDLETVREIGHDMKGVGKSYGFAGISNIGAAIETAAKKDDEESLKRGVSDFSFYMKNVKIASGDH